MTQTLDRPPLRALPSGRRRALRFGAHFLEMCAAMCLAWMVVTLPFVAIATAAGTSEPVRAWPELATVLALVAMSAGMAVQMRWRRHSWQCIGEMTAAMVIEAAVLLTLAAAGVLPRGDLFAWFHGLMPPTMVAAMVLRLDVYTSPLRHQHGATPASAP